MASSVSCFDSPPPSYRTLPPHSSRTNYSASERTSLLDSSSASDRRITLDQAGDSGSYGEQRQLTSRDYQTGGGFGDHLCAFFTLCCVAFFGGWLTAHLFSSTVDKPISFFSPTPEITSNAARSTSTWSIYYDNIDSPALASTQIRSLLIFENRTKSVASSVGKLYVEAWSSGAGAEITLETTSPCSMQAVDLHVGPSCMEEEDEKCHAIFATMQTYTNLTQCRINQEGGFGVNHFFFGISRMGKLYSLEQKGFNNGTDLVPRDDNGGFDWSWDANRQPDYSHSPKRGSAPKSSSAYSLALLSTTILVLHLV